MKINDENFDPNLVSIAYISHIFGKYSFERKLSYIITLENICFNAGIVLTSYSDLEKFVEFSIDDVCKFTIEKEFLVSMNSGRYYGNDYGEKGLPEYQIKINNDIRLIDKAVMLFFNNLDLSEEEFLLLYKLT